MSVSSSTLCVHCLVRPANTEDHWFPRAWWPKPEPAGLSRCVLPACLECNQRLGAVEDRLRSRLALALNPTAPAAHGLLPLVHRSMSPQLGRNERDRHAREARRGKLFREVFSAVPPNSVLPGLGPVPGVPFADQLATGVVPEDLEQFVAKLVRGLTYLDLQAFIPPSYTIRMLLLTEVDAPKFTRYLNPLPPARVFPPAIRARRARDANDPLSSLYEFIIWERLTLYALVHRRDIQERVEQNGGRPADQDIPANEALSGSPR